MDPAPYATGPGSVSNSTWNYAAAPNQHRSNLLGLGKRRADDDVESPAQSSISSQFKKLRLNQQLGHVPRTSQTYTSPTPPTSPPFACHDRRSRGATRSHEPRHHRGPPTDGAIPPSQITSDDDGDFMAVDETPHRIIIPDLEAEIAAIEADEAAARGVFLPDLDKKVSAIPAHLLRDRQPPSHMFTSPSPSTSSSSSSSTVPPTAALPRAENGNTAMVLYREPTSITVPEEEDMVRKAIVAARRRVREKQAEEQRTLRGESRAGERDAATVVDYAAGRMPDRDHDPDPDPNPDADPDAMDLG